ncbi:MAG: MoaD/ThiS family protein [Planctomycetaceae bacterium]|jgi:adenylyltransferase/sulfurtransferase|nr:MoaD/ThiS family protein [Planctomycetaceae bacterium]
MITIQLPTALRTFTDGQADLQFEALTVEAALCQLTEQFADLQRHLFDDNGKLRSFVNVYLNDEDVRSFDGVNTSLKDGDVLMLIPAIAGGRETPRT